MSEDLDIPRAIAEEDLNRATAEAIVETVMTGAEAHSFRRLATRFSKWGLPRSFVGYRADPLTQTSGSAPKWVLRSANDGEPQYIVKLPYRYGVRETLTELLINQLGMAFGFDMAHSGLVSVDGNPAFVSRSFLGQKEILVHGVFLIEEVHELPHGELETLPRQVAELKREGSGYNFRYLETFKQLQLEPLPGLPIDQVYTGAELPLYFRERMPDVRRADVQRIVSRYGIPVNDALLLLATLGRHTITDPFELQLSAA